MILFLMILTAIFVMVAGLNTDYVGEFNSIGNLCAILALICMVWILKLHG